LSEVRFRVAGFLGAVLVRVLFLTTRLTRVGAEACARFWAEGQPVMLIFWHGQMLPVVHHHRHKGMVALVSEHGDGEYLARILERNGFGTVRGSSTRGGSKGLKGLVRAARKGQSVVVTPDGPRGPRHEVKLGALAAAQLAGLPVVPVAVRVSSAWYFRSWDRFLVPRPFARVVLEYLPPTRIHPDAPREELELLARELGAALDRVGDP
jgi:lysophospholipid acyltransferase (LPLAT)-like uncharacterized protein